MNLMRGIVLACTSLMLAAAPTASTEIEALLQALRTSGCRFQRDDTWYDASRAADHLATKRDHLNRWNRIRSAEDFIRLAGTQSSMSGRAYRVACPQQPEVDSKTWLEAELLRIRGKTPGP
jgi:hypothetical protein